MPNPNHRPWTQEEIAVLRERYSDGVDAVRALLPHRSRSAIAHHAQRIGIGRKPHWTRSEDKLLEDRWSEGINPTRIAYELPRRSVVAIYTRARILGLGLGKPPGFEYLTEAALRCGFSHCSVLRKILRAHDVPIKTTMTKTRGRMWRKHIVDSHEVDLAVEHWAKTEPVAIAARRIGVAPITLRKWLALDGVVNAARHQHLRVTDEQVRHALRHRKNNDITYNESCVSQ